MRERSPQFGGESINGPSNRGRVVLTIKLNELLWPSMTFEVILIKMKYLCLHNISIHINLYQNWFINECARKIKAKILESHSFGVSEFQSFTVSQFQSFRVFFVRCRRTYVLNPESHSFRVFLWDVEDLMFLKNTNLYGVL